MDSDQDCVSVQVRQGNHSSRQGESVLNCSLDPLYSKYWTLLGNFAVLLMVYTSVTVGEPSFSVVLPGFFLVRIKLTEIPFLPVSYVR